MAVSTMSNMINPQVMGDMINAKIEAALKLTPYAKVDTSLVGVPGNTKTVACWQYIGDAADVSENSAIDFSTLSASSTTFTIKKAGKATAITTEAINSGLGQPVAQAEAQLAKAIASKVDNDVLDAAYTGTVVVAPATLAAIDYDGIVDAVTKFEDEEDGVEKVLFINPKQEAAMLKDGDFVSADKFTAGVAVNGAIGKVAGCWVKKSKKVRKAEYDIKAATASGYTEVTSENLSTYAGKYGWTGTALREVAVGDYVKAIASGSQYYVCPIIKLEAANAETEYTEDELPAITVFLKKDTTVSSDYNQTYDRTEIAAYRYYGVAKTNDAKLVLAKFLA